MSLLVSGPYPPYDPTDKKGFSYETVLKRWPVILTSLIDELHQQCHALTLELQSSADEKVRRELESRISEAKSIIGEISKLKYRMARDHPLELIPDDGEPYWDVYNRELGALAEQERNTWFTAPWLYAECYLYRFLRSHFARNELWKQFDPFLAQKNRAFQHSHGSVLQLATSMHELEREKSVLESDPTKLEVLFKEMIQMCLWGNATVLLGFNLNAVSFINDLSLLTHISATDIEKLQAVGKEAQAERKQFILKDDQEQVWNHLKSLHNGRVDFVLDNSGFELFTDLIFADFLVTYTPYVSKIIFHPKLIPWFVSDVTPPDFSQMFHALLDPSFFSLSPDNTPPGRQHLAMMVNRWKRYIQDGIFELSIPLENQLGQDTAGIASFWTSPCPYWDMKDFAPELYNSLRKSGLVIFKGDLNYRKLTGDIRWPAWTTFREATRGLAGSFPILSLRTNKADVVVGVRKETAEELDEKLENKWRVDGRYALISFLGRFE